jgi:hypothetical protein
MPPASARMRRGGMFIFLLIFKTTHYVSQSLQESIDSPQVDRSEANLQQDDTLDSSANYLLSYDHVKIVEVVRLSEVY